MFIFGISSFLFSCVLFYLESIQFLFSLFIYIYGYDTIFGLTSTYIPTFETVKAGYFRHFVTTEGPTMVGPEGKIFEF